MSVRRIVVNIAAETVPEIRKFYSDLFGLETIMDLGWVVTLASSETAVPQISILSEGGSGAPVPDLSIEVDYVDKVYRRAKKMGCKIIHDLTDEPWGVRRFFILDLTGKLLNVLSHRHQ
ncbi:MAG: VOC family protein [Usitatibacteraceae bacterium]